MYSVLCEYHLFTMFSVIHISKYLVHNEGAQHSMQCMDESIIFFFLTLQYCIGFAIHQNESATGIHMFSILYPPPSPYHPPGPSQCTSPKHPVLCIKPGLATRFIYDIIHISMPFSQIIPPSPSPTESKRLVFVSLIFSAICKASPVSHFAFLNFFFLGMVLITASCTMLHTSIHSSSGTLYQI